MGCTNNALAFFFAISARNVAITKNRKAQKSVLRF